MKYSILATLIAFLGLLSLNVAHTSEKAEIYNFTVNTIDGEETTLGEYTGKVMLVVNVASKCGLTPHYEGLQELYSKYSAKGLVVLGFPCNQFMSQEPGTESEIKEFCSTNYSITFPMFSKIDVNGDNAHPLYKYLTGLDINGYSGKIEWNFSKFLIDKSGKVVKRYHPKTAPADIAKDIEALL